jgi:hypothetical protein
MNVSIILYYFYKTCKQFSTFEKALSILLMYLFIEVKFTHSFHILLDPAHVNTYFQDFEIIFRVSATCPGAIIKVPRKPPIKSDGAFLLLFNFSTQIYRYGIDTPTADIGKIK